MLDEIHVIYEDKNFLAVYKPANLLVHPVRISNFQFPIFKKPTLVDWLLKHYPEIKNVGDPSTSSGQANLRPGIVHRLDKDTSGVILVARNQKYFNYLKHLFSLYERSPEGRQSHQIKKTYLALVYGELKPKTGVIKEPIRLKSGTIKRTIWKGKMEKQAITEYKVLKYYQRKSVLNQHKSATLSLLRVYPKTGRTHQIRVHLASIGHPIVGDALYGPKKSPSTGSGQAPLDLKRLFLHAESLEFSTVEGSRIKIEAALPEELKIVLRKIKT